MTRHKRIIAIFHPQAWINNYAVEVDGQMEIDVTEAVLELGKEKALALRDDQYETDDLVIGRHDHTGPFWVEVEQSIADYYNGEVTQ